MINARLPSRFIPLFFTWFSKCSWCFVWFVGCGMCECGCFSHQECWWGTKKDSLLQLKTAQVLYCIALGELCGPFYLLGFHQHYLISESCQDLTQPELSWEKLSLFEGRILCLELLGKKKTAFTLYLLAIRSLCFIISWNYFLPNRVSRTPKPLPNAHYLLEIPSCLSFAGTVRTYLKSIDFSLQAYP